MEEKAPGQGGRAGAVPAHRQDPAGAFRKPSTSSQRLEKREERRCETQASYGSAIEKSPRHCEQPPWRAAAAAFLHESEGNARGAGVRADAGRPRGCLLGRFRGQLDSMRMDESWLFCCLEVLKRQYVRIYETQ